MPYTGSQQYGSGRDERRLAGPRGLEPRGAGSYVPCEPIYAGGNMIKGNTQQLVGQYNGVHNDKPRLPPNYNK